MTGGSAETRDIDARGTARPLADVAMVGAMAGVDDATLGGRIDQTARAFALDRCDASPICTTSFWERCKGWQGGRRDRSHDGRGSVGGKARERGKSKKQTSRSLVQVVVESPIRGRGRRLSRLGGGRRMGKYQPCLPDLPALGVGTGRQVEIAARDRPVSVVLGGLDYTYKQRAR